MVLPLLACTRQGAWLSCPEASARRSTLLLITSTAVTRPRARLVAAFLWHPAAAAQPAALPVASGHRCQEALVLLRRDERAEAAVLSLLPAALRSARGSRRRRCAPMRCSRSVPRQAAAEAVVCCPVLPGRKQSPENSIRAVFVAAACENKDRILI